MVCHSAVLFGWNNWGKTIAKLYIYILLHQNYFVVQNSWIYWFFYLIIHREFLQPFYGDLQLKSNTNRSNILIYFLLWQTLQKNKQNIFQQTYLMRQTLVQLTHYLQSALFFASVSVVTSVRSARLLTPASHSESRVSRHTSRIAPAVFRVTFVKRGSSLQWSPSSFLP